VTTGGGIAALALMTSRLFGRTRFRPPKESSTI